MHSDSSTSLSASRSIEAGMFLIVCRFGRRVAASPDAHRRAAALAQNGALFAPILPDPEDFVPPRATSHSSQSPVRSACADARYSASLSKFQKFAARPGARHRYRDQRERIPLGPELWPSVPRRHGARDAHCNLIGITSSRRGREPSNDRREPSSRRPTSLPGSEERPASDKSDPLPLLRCATCLRQRRRRPTPPLPLPPS